MGQYFQPPPQFKPRGTQRAIMNGFPKHIATKQDLENLAQDFPNEVVNFMQGVVSASAQWVMTGELSLTAKGKTDETHKIEELKDRETEQVTQRYQYEWKVDPTGKVFQLGFASVQEAEAFIAKVQK